MTKETFEKVFERKLSDFGEGWSSLFIGKIEVSAIDF
jgi:hypothetical protein